MKNEKVKKDETRLGAAQNDGELNFEKIADKIVGGASAKTGGPHGCVEKVSTVDSTCTAAGEIAYGCQAFQPRKRNENG